MKDDLLVIVKDDIYTSGANILTTVYIDYQGTSFPDSQWTDFTESILGMWVYNLLKYKDMRNVSFALPFMDGPFRIDVIKGSEMDLTLKCINGRENDKVEMTIICKYVDLLSAVYKALRKLGKILYENDLHRSEFQTSYNNTLITCKDLKAIIESL